MSTPKGYPSQEKEDRLSAQFTTVSPVGYKKHGLDVVDKSTVSVAASDAVEANSTTTTIVATAHVAKVGDKIRFTSGTHNTLELDVYSVDTNSFVLGQTLSVAPSPGDTFDILRQTSLTLTSGGTISTTSGPVQFVLDGVDTEVEEDTITPANNRPLPVKLIGMDGDVVINSNNLNLEVQLEHDTADYDSVRIGDGTETVAVNASNEMQVADDTARTSLGTIAGAVSGSEMQVDVVAPLPAGTNNIGDVDVLTLPDVTQSTHDNLNLNANIQVGDADVANGNPVPVSDAGGSITVDATDLDIRDLAHTQDSVQIGDGTEIAAVNASNELQVRDNDANTSLTTLAGAVSGTEVQVDVVAALPAGTNNIGDVDVLTEPATAADNAVGLPSVVKVVAGFDGANVQALSTDSSGVLNVNATATVARLDVVDFLDTNPVLDTSSSNIPDSGDNPLEVVASLASDVQQIRVNDTTGKFIGVYTGAALSEVLQCVIGPGMDGVIEVSMSSGERVSLRHMSNTDITVGELLIQFNG